MSLRGSENKELQFGNIRPIRGDNASVSVDVVILLEDITVNIAESKPFPRAINVLVAAEGKAVLPRPHPALPRRIPY